MRKKIVFVIHELTVGGAERVIVNIMNNIDRNKYEIHLIIFKNIGELKDELKDDIIIHDLQVLSVKKGLFKLYKTIKDLNPEILFSGIAHVNLMISMMIPFLPKNIKFIARETNTVSMQLQTEKQAWIYKIMYQLFYNNYQLIIAQSNYMKNDLVQNYSIEENKIKVIYNPVDLKKIKDKLNGNEISFPKDQCNLIVVGGLRYQKGYDILLQSITKLNSKYHLYFIGNGKEKESLIKLISHLNINDRVHFLGFQNNPYQYMAQANIMVLSSRYEGLPNVVLEANICGLPVVAFDCPGGTSEVIENGVNGFLVECGNKEKLANKIQEAVKYNWNKEKIKQSIKKRYSVEYIIEKYQQQF